MKVLVDTSIWSLALRHDLPSDGPEVSELSELIKESRVQMITGTTGTSFWYKEPSSVTETAQSPAVIS